MQREAKKSSRSMLFLLVCFVFFFFYYFNAYLCDDSFIIFRTLDNFVRGHGLRWNTIERVQVFTCPLYTLLLSPFYFLIHDHQSLPNPTRVWLFVMSATFLFSFSTVLVIWKRFRNLNSFFVVFGLLLSSQAYVTFMSSGLETSLSYLLIALFFTRYLLDYPSNWNKSDFFAFFLLASLATCNRLDLALLFLPACLHLFILGLRQNTWKFFGLVSVALSPLFIWFLFSLVYFGFILPNTYYAKMGFPFDATVLLRMGIGYLRESFSEDPLTLILIVLATFTCWIRLPLFLAQLGSLFYVIYITKIGGDFLGFRFLAMSLLVSVLVLGVTVDQQKFTLKNNLLALLFIALCILYSLFIPFSPLRVYLEGPRATDVKYYYFASALRYYRPGREFPFSPFHAVRNTAYCQACRVSSFQVHVTGGGIRGFCRGPLDHLIEPQRITDPLLARLPAPNDQGFSPGHLMQDIPAGYVESVETGQNLISDPDLAHYYAKIRAVVSGDLFTLERWRFIYQLNFTSERRYRKPYLIANPAYPYDRR